MGLTCAMDHTHMGTARHRTHTHMCAPQWAAHNQMQTHTQKKKNTPRTFAFLSTPFPAAHTQRTAKQASVAIPTVELVKSSAALYITNDVII